MESSIFDQDPIAKVISLKSLDQFPSAVLQLKDHKDITKYVIKEGEGEILEESSKFQLKTVLRNSDGSLYEEKGVQQNQVKNYQLLSDSKKCSQLVFPQLKACVLTMRVGEIAYLRCPDLLPGQEACYYRIELVKETKSKAQVEGTAPRNFFSEIKLYEEMKNTGNHHFILKEYEEAADSYIKGARNITCFPKKTIKDFTEEERIYYFQTRDALVNNMMKALYHCKKYEQALEEYGKIRKVMKGNVKLYVSYLNILLALHKEDDIKQAIKELIKENEEDQNLVEELEKIEKEFDIKIRSKTKKENELYRRNFKVSQARYAEQEKQNQIWSRISKEEA